MSVNARPVVQRTSKVVLEKYAENIYPGKDIIFLLLDSTFPLLPATCSAEPRSSNMNNYLSKLNTT